MPARGPVYARGAVARSTGCSPCARDANERTRIVSRRTRIVSRRRRSTAYTKWRLRKGAYLEADATRTIAQDEQLLLYRAFRPFRADGNLVKALHVLAGSLLDPDLIEWRDAESAMLPDLQEKTTRAREQHECQSPPADHPTRADPYAHGGSMDCHFVGAADHARLEQRAQYDLLAQALLAKGGRGPLRLRLLQVHNDDRSDAYEWDAERALDNDGRRSGFYGTPAGDLPAHAEAPRDWTPQEQLRMERAQERGPPPWRDDPRYGPRANNPEGDARFRDDRAEWYQAIMGEPLPNDLKQQWRLCHAVARRYRVDHTRSGRPPEHH